MLKKYSFQYVLTTLTHPGMLRPKPFFEVSLKCPDLPDMELSQYVLMVPMLLRIRLMIAKIKLRLMARQLIAFRVRHKM